MRLETKAVWWTLTVIAVSAVTSFFIANLARDTKPPTHPQSPSTAAATFHEWLHTELKITPKQEKDLAPIESAFARQRTIQLERIRKAGESLASALEKTSEDREEINRALQQIHSAQGDLQKDTINHFLEMKEHLSADQADLLLQWTRESITHDEQR